MAARGCCDGATCSDDAVLVAAAAADGLPAAWWTCENGFLTASGLHPLCKCRKIGEKSEMASVVELIVHN